MGSIVSLAAGLLGNWQRILLYGALLLSVAALLIGYGFYLGSRRLFEYQGEQAKEGARIVVKQGEITVQIVREYIQVAADAVIVEKTVEREVIKYADSNAGHCLDAEWRKLHDASSGAVPDTAGGDNGSGGAPPTAAEAIKTVTENNARCIRTANRLDAAQEWIRRQEAANREP